MSTNFFIHEFAQPDPSIGELDKFLLIFLWYIRGFWVLTSVLIRVNRVISLIRDPFLSTNFHELI